MEVTGPGARRTVQVILANCARRPRQTGTRWPRDARRRTDSPAPRAFMKRVYRSPPSRRLWHHVPILDSLRNTTTNGREPHEKRHQRHGHRHDSDSRPTITPKLVAIYRTSAHVRARRASGWFERGQHRAPPFEGIESLQWLSMQTGRQLVLEFAHSPRARFDERVKSASPLTRAKTAAMIGRSSQGSGVNFLGLRVSI